MTFIFVLSADCVLRRNATHFPSLDNDRYRDEAVRSRGNLHGRRAASERLEHDGRVGIAHDEQRIPVHGYCKPASGGRDGNLSDRAGATGEVELAHDDGGR